MRQKPQLIIPHRILQRLQTILRNMISCAQAGKEYNDSTIINQKLRKAEVQSYLYEIRNIYSERIVKLVQIQTKVKRVKSGKELFTNSDLQRLEQFLTSVHFLEGIPEIQVWARKQKAFSEV